MTREEFPGLGAYFERGDVVYLFNGPTDRKPDGYVAVSHTADLPPAYFIPVKVVNFSGWK